MAKIIPLKKRLKKRTKYWRKLYNKIRAIPLALLALLVVSGFALLTLDAPTSSTALTSDNDTITCRSPYIIDGDTFSCGGERIRLAGIDTPEMPGHCRQGRKCTAGDPHAARKSLVTLSRGSVTCQPIERDHYGRIIARCSAKKEDLSCAMLKTQHAVRRYGNISCI